MPTFKLKEELTDGLNDIDVEELPALLPTAEFLNAAKELIKNPTQPGLADKVKGLALLNKQQYPGIEEKFNKTYAAMLHKHYKGKDGSFFVPGT